jgi:peptidoglycan/xylan/chitin deacetylase (PgdA/CDA1 family)
MSLGEFIRAEDLFVDRARTGDRLRFLVTFDDGYANNYRLARPILEEFGVPAVFFVSTEHMRSGNLFWFDEIVTPIQHLGLDTLDLREFGLERFTFSPPSHAGERWDQIDRLLVAIERMGNADHPRAAALLSFLRSKYHASAQALLEKYKPITADQVRSMHEHPLFEFGSHGHEHSILTYLDDVALRSSLRTSASIMEEITGSRPMMFAYPNGDFDDRVVSATAETGYTLAFTTTKGFLGQADNRLTLPRLLVGGYDSVDVLRYQLNRMALRTPGTR